MIAEFLTQLINYANFSTVIFFLIVAYVTWKLYDGYNLPPGPRGLPLIGYLPFIGSKPSEETFNDLSKKYGNVMSINFGGQIVVVLNNYEAIKEAYIKQGDNFAGRPPEMKFEPDDGGVFASDGEPWREHRRFILSTLRDYGMGKLSLEPRIMEEIHFFLNELAEQKGKPFDFHYVLGMSTANIISTLEFGKRFDYKDERFIKLRKLQDEGLKLFSTVNPIMIFRFLRHLKFLDPITHMDVAREITSFTEKFIKDMINEHKAEYNENSRKDLVDAVITEINSIVKKTGTEGHFNEKEVIGTLMGLFGAGADTTTSTLRWAILYLLLHPEIQMKIQKEIDEVIGMERSPTMSDKTKMVFTEAFLLEVQRAGSLLPLNAPHNNLEETEVFGYRIPKRTMILTNLWAVHNDPQLWDQPEKFMPERFINKDGKVEKPEYLIPFGIGKRACVGESLARMELFLYFTSLLQRFTFEPPKGVIPELKFESKFFRRPTSYEICASQRPGYSV